VLVDRSKAPLREGEASVEAAVVCVKTLGTAWAADIARRILSPDGVAVTIQNGLGNYEMLHAAVGDRASVGVTYVGARLDEAGELHATGPGRVELGWPRSTISFARMDALATLLREGGMTVTMLDDPWLSVWRKVAVNASMNPTTAILGYTNAQLLADAVATRLVDAIASEVGRVATASGVALGDDDARNAWRAIAEVTGSNRSSMLQDVEAKRVTEIDAICGAVSREGQRRGVDAPLNQSMAVLVAALHP